MNGKIAGIIILVTCIALGLVTLLIGLKIIPSVDTWFHKDKQVESKVEVAEEIPVQQEAQEVPVVKEEPKEPKEDIAVYFLSNVEKEDTIEAIGTVISKTYGLNTGEYSSVSCYLFIDIPMVGVVPYTISASTYDSVSVGAKVNVSYFKLKAGNNTYPMINSISLI